MATSIAERRETPATASWPQPSRRLADLLTDRAEGYLGEKGFEVRNTWSPPAVLEPAVRNEARDLLAQVNCALSDHADSQAIAAWVGKLGILVAGSMTADDARAKMAGYGSMLAGRYPRALLSRDVLDRCARAFKWFPSYSELADRLDLEHQRLKREQKRLEALVGRAEGPAPTPVRRLVADVVKPVVPKREPPPEKASAIVHPPSAEQIAEWAKAVA